MGNRREEVGKHKREVQLRFIYTWKVLPARESVKVFRSVLSLESVLSLVELFYLPVAAIART